MKNIIVLTLCAAALPVMADMGTDALANCELNYPGDRNMVAFCVREEFAAEAVLTKVYNRGGIGARAVQMCLEVSPGAIVGTDYQDALNCTRTALKELRR